MSKRRISDASSETWSAVDSPGIPIRNKVRIIAVFTKDHFGLDTRIIVPVTPSSTIDELKSEVIRRASSMGLKVPSSELALHLDSEQGAVAFGEDLVQDVIDMQEKQNTVWVRTQKTSGSEAPPFNSSDNYVYLRLITPSKALQFASLSAIPALESPVKNTTLVSALEEIAYKQIYHKDPSPSSNLKLRIFTTACELPTSASNRTTLKGYGFTGTIGDPLNIFIVPVRHLHMPKGGNAQDLWGFDYSLRGLAVFQTCLKVLMAKAHTEPVLLRRLLKALFNLTHFPPVLQAFQVLVTENKLVPDSVVILATCFNELALRMVPSDLVLNDSSAALEGSRQIFAWLFSIHRRTLNQPDVASAALVRRVQLQDIRDATGINFSQPGDRLEVIEIYAAGDSAKKSPSSPVAKNETTVADRSADGTVGSPQDIAQPSGLESEGATNEGHTTEKVPPGEVSLHQVIVCTDENCQEDLKALALAFWGKYDPVTNYYVDFRDSIDRPLEQRHTHLLGTADFNQLLMEANNCEHFQMFSPQELNGKTSTVITLSKGGLVSLHSVDDIGCGTIQHSIENAVVGRQVTRNDPGPEILAALQLIIPQRKQDGTWDLDDWALARQVKITDDIPDEAVVICFDLSWSMDEALGDNWTGDGTSNTFRKIDEAKQVFRNVVARMGKCKTQVHVGLVSFSDSSRVRVRAPIRKVGDRFHTQLEQATVRGQTALWDSLLRAKDMLMVTKSKYPKAKLRIIALTDGEDNDSEIADPEDICQQLYDAKIVLDSLIIGSDETEDLFKISKHTGGYAFCPSSRSLLFQTFLLEPFFDISTRPDINRIPITDYETSTPKEMDMATIYDLPPCRPHPLQDGSFISLSDASRFFAAKSTSLLDRQLILSNVPALDQTTSPMQQTTSSYSLQSNRPHTALKPNQGKSGQVQGFHRSERSGVSFGKLYLDEMRLMVGNPSPFMDVYVNESDMSFWKVVMSGPPDSAYKNGNFALYVHLKDGYPQKAPNVRFITPLLHPNITRHGRICHGILAENWNPNFHIYEVLQDIYGLLATAEEATAIDEMAALRFRTDAPAAEAEIRKYVDKFAKRSRAEWKSEILRLYL